MHIKSIQFTSQIQLVIFLLSLFSTLQLKEPQFSKTSTLKLWRYLQLLYPYFLHAINLYIRILFLHLPFCSVLTATAPGLGPHYLSSSLLQWLPNWSPGHYNSFIKSIHTTARVIFFFKNITLAPILFLKILKRSPLPSELSPNSFNLLLFNFFPHMFPILFPNRPHVLHWTTCIFPQTCCVLFLLHLSSLLLPLHKYRTFFLFRFHGLSYSNSNTFIRALGILCFLR